MGGTPDEALSRHRRKVGKVLGSMPVGWHCVHAIPLADGSIIDHVVVGPPGVFVVSAVIPVEGDRQDRPAEPMLDAIDNTKRQRGAVVAMLARRGGEHHRVDALVVTATPFDNRVEPEVAVVARRQLRRWLFRQHVNVSIHGVEQLYETIRSLDSWRYP